jgi:hypothetical protein
VAVGGREVIAHKVIRKMLAVFEEELAREENRSSGRLATNLVRELCHSDPGGKGNLLSQAYNEIQVGALRAKLGTCTAVIVRLYSSRASGGMTPPTPAAIREALACARELDSQGLTRTIDERDFVIANYERVSNGETWANLCREAHPGVDVSQSKIDAFRRRARSILNEEGIEPPPGKPGRPRRS